MLSLGSPIACSCHALPVDAHLHLLTTLLFLCCLSPQHIVCIHAANHQCCVRTYALASQRSFSCVNSNNVQHPWYDVQQPDHGSPHAGHVHAMSWGGGPRHVAHGICSWRAHGRRSSPDNSDVHNPRPSRCTARANYALDR